MLSAGFMCFGGSTVYLYMAWKRTVSIDRPDFYRSLQTGLTLGAGCFFIPKRSVRDVIYIASGTCKLLPLSPVLSQRDAADLCKVSDIVISKEKLQAFNEQQKQRSKNHIKVCLAAVISVLGMRILYSEINSR